MSSEIVQKAGAMKAVPPRVTKRAPPPYGGPSRFVTSRGGGKIGGSVMAVRTQARGRPKAKEPVKQLASVRATAREIERWRKAWGIGPEMHYVGWADPLPMPPGEPCKPCLGGIRYWTEAEVPHQGWRCVSCHPTPTGTATRLYEIDEQAEAAERQRIEDAATPKPQPKPSVTTTDNWWE